MKPSALYIAGLIVATIFGTFGLVVLLFSIPAWVDGQPRGVVSGVGLLTIGFLVLVLVQILYAVRDMQDKMERMWKDLVEHPREKTEIAEENKCVKPDCENMIYSDSLKLCRAHYEEYKQELKGE